MTNGEGARPGARGVSARVGRPREFETNPLTLLVTPAQRAELNALAVRRSVGAGRHVSVSEVVRGAIDLLLEKEAGA